MTISVVISKTVFRILLVSGFLSLINEAAPNYATVHLANWLLPIWAVSLFLDPIGRMCARAFYRYRQVAQQRRQATAQSPGGEAVVAEETQPLDLGQWGLHE